MKTSGLTHSTDTTGTVKGIEEVKNFISMCNSKFDKVYIIGTITDETDYLQYTLLLNNEIRIYI